MPRIPKYRPHSSRRFAMVEYRGKRIRLPGKWNSTESKSAYRQFVAKLVAPDEAGEDDSTPAIGLSVAELAARYLRHAEAYYRGNQEYGCTVDACGPLLARYGDLVADQFGPRRLKRVRKIMLAGSWQEAWQSRRRWSRRYINHQINRLRRMFRWAVSEELLPARVIHALETLQPLRRGRGDAAEATDRQPISPVPDEHIDTVVAYMPPPVRAMVELQRLTGMRSQNVTAMRLSDLDRSGDVWEYVPAEHKSAWKGRRLFIALGPRCQEILRPFLDRPAEAFLFSPAESHAWRSHQRRAARVSPMTPSQSARTPKPLPRRLRPPGERYTPTTYRRAVEYAVKSANRAIEKANANLMEYAHRKPPIPTFCPHRLRHNAGTNVRR